MEDEEPTEGLSEEDRERIRKEDTVWGASNHIQTLQSILESDGVFGIFMKMLDEQCAEIDYDDVLSILMYNVDLHVKDIINDLDLMDHALRHRYPDNPYFKKESGGVVADDAILSALRDVTEGIHGHG